MPQRVVVYDACILYSAPLRDLLMRLALTDLYQAKWTEDIHEEWIRNLLKNRPDLTRDHLEKIKDKMNKHIRDCLINGYHKLIKSIDLPDPDDRHVLAAAIYAKAHYIVTFNLSDFPEKKLKMHNVRAIHPDNFLLQIFDSAPNNLMQTIRETRINLKNPPKTVAEYLQILEKQSLNKTVALLKNYSDYL